MHELFSIQETICRYFKLTKINISIFPWLLLSKYFFIIWLENFVNNSVIFQTMSFKCIWIRCAFHKNTLTCRHRDHHGLSQTRESSTLEPLFGQVWSIFNIQYFFRNKNNFQRIFIVKCLQTVCFGNIFLIKSTVWRNEHAKWFPYA